VVAITTIILTIMASIIRARLPTPTNSNIIDLLR